MKFHDDNSILRNDTNQASMLKNLKYIREFSLSKQPDTEPALHVPEAEELFKMLYAKVSLQSQPQTNTE